MAILSQSLVQLFENSWASVPLKACVDSRFLQKQDVFFALEGAKVDGHQFLEEAASKGAAAAVVSASYRGQDFGLTLIPSENPLRALQELARLMLEKRKLKIIAITGSYGKTTTKDFLTGILKEKYTVASSPGNSNSQIGLPLALLNQVIEKEELFVLEMGMTHAGNIKRLVEIAPPDLAIITSVALVHACNFESLDAIALAKAEIFSHPRTKAGILSKEISSYETICNLGNFPKYSFSASSRDADYCLEMKDGKHAFYERQGHCQIPPLAVPGKHNYHNLAAAVAAARQLNVGWEEICRAIPKLRLYERRLEHVELKGILFVNDSYNANAISMKAALESLPTPTHGGKTIALLGEMLELGSFSDACHLEVGEAALSRADSMICLGNHCRPIAECWEKAKRPVKWVFKFEEAVAELQKQVMPGDVVLLKGSRSNGLWRVLQEFQNNLSL